MLAVQGLYRYGVNEARRHFTTILNAGPDRQNRIACPSELEPGLEICKEVSEIFLGDDLFQFLSIRLCRIPGYTGFRKMSGRNRERPERDGVIDASLIVGLWDPR